METGKYSNKKVDFTKFDTVKFPFTIYDPDIYGTAPCYANLLATIVGKENPYKIKALNKNKESGDDKFVCSYLKKHGFKIQPLTQCLLSNRKHQDVQLNGIIKKYNVIITSNLVKRNECTWFCIYNNYVTHNQVISPLNNLDFLNFPLHTAYLIHSKKYQ